MGVPLAGHWWDSSQLILNCVEILFLNKVWHSWNLTDPSPILDMTRVDVNNSQKKIFMKKYSPQKSYQCNKTVSFDASCYDFEDIVFITDR